jgi:cytochrome P450
MTGEPMTLDLRNDAEFWQDPYPVWRKAMSQNRTARSTSGEVVLLRADDLDTVHTSSAFRVLGAEALDLLGIHDGPFYAWRRLALTAQEGPTHARLRSLVARSFTSRRVNSIRAGLRRHSSGILDAWPSGKPFDVVSNYAKDIPLWSICEFLGLPLESRDEINDFLVGTEEGFTDPMTATIRARSERGIVALYGYVEELIERRTCKRGPDLVSDLLDDERDGRIERDELLALVVNIIGGAVGSSRAAISNSILLLLRHRDQLHWARSDPLRTGSAIEECLRFNPPFRTGRRKTVCDAELFDLHLPSETVVVFSAQAANRDPARWDDPDRFDVSRIVQRHYSFGFGAHLCLGQALARQNIQEAVSVFIHRFPMAELLCEQPPRVPFTPDDALRHLPVQLVA